MSEKPFIKFYSSDFLAGTSGLSPEERGVYITLLCLMYEADGPIKDDAARLARRCGTRPVNFRRALEALIDTDKITRADGMLFNRTAEKRIIDRHDRVTIATSNANKRWSASSEKTQQNQHPENATAMRPQCGGNANQSQSQSITEDTSVSSTTTAKKQRGERLSENWTLPKEWGDWALSEGWPESVIRFEADKFRDYWTAKAGRDAAKRDWLATWRNWMRNSTSPKVVNGDGNGKSSKSNDAFNAFIAGARGSS